MYAKIMVSFLAALKLWQKQQNCKSLIVKIKVKGIHDFFPNTHEIFAKNCIARFSKFVFYETF